MKNSRLVMVVRGRVQGVFYRASTRQKAEQLGLSGWVRNLPDGSVEVVAEGPDAGLQTLESWCRRGPPAAKVRALERWDEPASGEFEGFGIRY